MLDTVWKSKNPAGGIKSTAVSILIMLDTVWKP